MIGRDADAHTFMSPEKRGPESIEGRVPSRRESLSVDYGPRLAIRENRVGTDARQPVSECPRQFRQR